MRIVRFWNPAQNKASYGVIEGDRVRELAGEPWPEIVRTSASHPLDGVRLLAPCTPSKVVCGGLNYYSHAKEFNMPVPEVPACFLKAPTSVIGHGEAIQYPAMTKQLEHEAELALVIKKPMRNVAERDAYDYVLGYACTNDLTARDFQFAGPQLLNLGISKSLDTFNPVGPWIETDLDPSAIDITLRVNGEVRQQVNTSDMIFPVPVMLSYFSSMMTLLPGDLILTGTPAGVSPMKVGDTVEVEIAGIGTLSNPIVEDPTPLWRRGN